ncbi:MAG TPA: choice-of-anchor tandem repeat GloVer-containing protein, partial [Gemmataceae bacterium]|nr:choice-of-anchor tandem repeat GloVer-containing protein [Gemmataceae bacterium]
MFFSFWLRNWKQSLEGRSAPRQTPRHRTPAHSPARIRPCLEVLEDRLAPANFMSVYDFTGGSLGSMPNGGVILDSSGNLYGTTETGGAHSAGILYQFTPSNDKFTVLHSFLSSTDGITPEDTLIQDSNGNFYGTAAGGGTGSQGTVFQLSSDDTTFTTLHNFAGSEGTTPESNLLMDSKGNLYGTTSGGGGTGGAGTVFELSPNGSGGYNLTTLHTFTTTGSDGTDPVAGLLMDSKGNLYGTTKQGGIDGDGTVYELSPNGTGGYNYSTIYSFDGSDGQAPMGGLIMDSKGNLYGTTQLGGTDSSGTVFQLSPNGTGGYNLTTLYAFTGGSDGAQPEDTLLMDAKGNLFGTTYQGGISQDGTVFELSPNGSGGYNFTTLHKFNNASVGDGANPVAGLTLDGNGNLYGTTTAGGDGYGTIFEITGAAAIAAPTVTTASNATATFSTNTQNVMLKASVTSSDGSVDEGKVTFTVVNGTGATIGAATGSVTSSGSASGTLALPAYTNVGSYTIDASYTDSSGNFADSNNASQSPTPALSVTAAGTTTTAQSTTATFSASKQDATLKA